MFVTSCSFEEAIKIHTGEANAESPHLAVPLYTPLAKPLTPGEALEFVRPDLREEVERGEARLVAVAHGTMARDGTPAPLQLVLFHTDEGYTTFSTLDDEYEVAVLMDGDGRRYLKADPLPEAEAVSQWVAGFLNWNCEVPGLYRLRYAMIEPETR